MAGQGLSFTALRPPLAVLTDAEGGMLVDSDSDAVEPRAGRRGRSFAAKVAAALVGVLLVAGAAVAMQQRRPAGEPVGALDAIVEEVDTVFDCEAALDRSSYEWSEAKKIYCCSHFRKGCPKMETVSITFVISNIHYEELKKHSGTLDDLIQKAKATVATVADANGNVKPEHIRATWWEGSGIYSTKGASANERGMVVRAEVDVQAPADKDQVHQKLSANDSKEFIDMMEAKLREVSALNCCYTDLPHVKLGVVEMKIVSACTCANGTPEVQPACPAMGGEICKTCSDGYFLTSGSVCHMNQCTCKNGTAAEGAICPQNGRAWCANCQVGFHLVQDVVSQSRACVQNTCTCKNGTAATGAMCRVDKGEICTTCAVGLHRSESFDCVANKCDCTNGAPAKGDKCTKHETLNCQECNAGFHVDASGGCSRNTCTCEFGQVALGDMCTTDHGEICAYCIANKHLRKDGACGEKECHCPNGTAATGAACKTHNSILCTSCAPGYMLNNLQCVSTGCTCDNGVAAAGDACPYSGKHICITCHEGYHLNGGTGQCEPNKCTCVNGAAAMGASCRVSGSQSCSKCDVGFHIALGNVQDAEGVKLAVLCKENQCVCPDGTPANGTSQTKCYHHQSIQCDSCKPGFHIDLLAGDAAAGTNTHHQCKRNVCKCTHGTPVEDIYCTKDKAENCASCEVGYFPTKKPLLDYQAVPGHAPPPEKEFDGTNTVCAFSGLTTSLTFDCQSALANWEAAWSKLKKQWCCQHKKLGCKPVATQKQLCEGKNFGLEQCEMIGCCRFDPGLKQCMHATGDGSAICHPEYNIKTAGGKCLTTVEHQKGALLDRSLKVQDCSDSVVTQHWAPSSRGAGMSIITDVEGNCFTLKDQKPKAEVTAAPCSQANPPNLEIDLQVINFRPVAGQTSVGTMVSKSGLCLTVSGDGVLVDACNAADMNQQFTAQPLLSE